jgi:hypothetical protein
VIKAIAIGHGGGNSIAAAKKGINTTEDPTRAVEILGFGKKDESLAIPRTVNAINPFQRPVSLRVGMNHGEAARIPTAPVQTAPNKSLKVSRSRSGWL